MEKENCFCSLEGQKVSRLESYWRGSCDIFQFLCLRYVKDIGTKEKASNVSKTLPVK